MYNYHLGSILFGLLAWLLPLCALAGTKKPPLVRAGLTNVSFACCALALCLQIMEVRRLVDLSDWSSLMDTQNAVVFVSTVLLVVTAALNALVWLVRIRRGRG